jgi:nucleotidyltransferase/DNA polymerase involved in DNA repair
MDAFYASVELAERPDLRGVPLVVGGDPREGKGRGVVLTASYEARKHGLRSAMPISRAWRLLPQGVYVRPRFDLYEAYSRRIMDALRGLVDRTRREAGVDDRAPGFEQASIDEAVLDCGAALASGGTADRVAVDIQRAVMEAAKVTCSVGIATGKVTAKIASETRKPEGVAIVPPGTERVFLAPLPASRIPGIGPKTAAALEKSAVRTIGDLASAAPSVLRRLMGRSAPWFLRIARGEDDSMPSGGWEAKSLSAEHTFDEDVEDRGAVAEVLDSMASRLAAELGERGLSARNVTIKIRFEGFDTKTVSRTTPSPVSDVDSISRAAQELLKRLSMDPRRVRLAGLRVADLRRTEGGRRIEAWRSPEPSPEVPHADQAPPVPRRPSWRF